MQSSETVIREASSFLPLANDSRRTQASGPRDSKEYTSSKPRKNRLGLSFQEKNGSASNSVHFSFRHQDAAHRAYESRAMRFRRQPLETKNGGVVQERQSRRLRPKFPTPTVVRQQGEASRDVALGGLWGGYVPMGFVVSGTCFGWVFL